VNSVASQFSPPLKSAVSFRQCLESVSNQLAVVMHYLKAIKAAGTDDADKVSAQMRAKRNAANLRPPRRLNFQVSLALLRKLVLGRLMVRITGSAASLLAAVLLTLTTSVSSHAQKRPGPPHAAPAPHPAAPPRLAPPHIAAPPPAHFAAPPRPAAHIAAPPQPHFAASRRICRIQIATRISYRWRSG
jgi:hypothetical protein